MAEHTANETVPALVALTCDCCGTRHDEVTERQEFLRWKDTAGYGNRTFGDGARVAIDLCQYCVVDKLGPWVRVDAGT